MSEEIRFSLRAKREKATRIERNYRTQKAILPGGLGINDVFADLVDHDAAGLDSTQDDKDKESAEDGVRPSTEQSGEFSIMTDLEPQSSHINDDQEVPAADSAFMTATEISPGAHDNGITQLSPGPKGQAEDFVDPGLDGPNDAVKE